MGWYLYRTANPLSYVQQIKSKGAKGNERIQYRKRIYGLCGRRVSAFRQRSRLQGMDGRLTGGTTIMEVLQDAGLDPDEYDF